ncbi:hypothetical protein AADG42_10010 [Ammonicoccus fulvus]|uniref:Uncharacterized protein n=1 Tax=Ammonicoccus fulvus TaxID=3138240 RepID=A0ABZ3FRA4_9ACTN
MTVSMRVMSAGDGYKYLLKSVAAGDGDRSLSTPLTRYYAEARTPSGSKASCAWIEFVRRNSIECDRPVMSIRYRSASRLVVRG